MSAHNPISASTGPGSHHGRSASDQPIPSAVHSTPNSLLHIHNDGPSTHPCRTKQRKNFFQIPNPHANQNLTAGLPNNPSYPSPQVNRVRNADLPSHPNPQSPEANSFHNTCTLFTNDTAVQAHSAGLYYNTTVLTRRKHWYFLIQITVPPPSIMNVRHNMSSRQRAKARLHQLTLNKRSINGQRGFIRGSIDRMEARLEVLEKINQNPAEPNTKLSELYAVEAALEKADDDMTELARLWDQYEQEYDQIMTEIAVGEHGN